MDYLDVCYLESKCLELFLLSLCCWFLFSFLYGQETYSLWFRFLYIWGLFLIQDMVCLAPVRYSVLFMSANSTKLIMVFGSYIFLLIFCLVLKLPTIIVGFSMSNFRSDSICFTDFEALLLGIYTFRIVKSVGELITLLAVSCPLYPTLSL